jgi:ribonuclease-3 family protein
MEESVKTTQEAADILMDQLKEALMLQDVDVRSYSPLALAWIGDAVYEVLIRTKVMNHGSMQVNKMHKKGSSLVKAGTQAELVKILSSQFTEEEEKVYKRGRNAKAVTSAKNATMIDYRMATGFEALVGYLYLTRQTDRLIQLVHDGLDQLGELTPEESRQ